MRQFDTQKKIQLLQQHLSAPKMESAATILTTVRTEQTPENIQRLRVILSSATETYIRQFFDANGLQTLLEITNSIVRKS